MQTLAEGAVHNVTVENVEVRAGRGRVLVAPFTWTHQGGGIAWLMGENGTGKSSLLRVLAGCQRPFAGLVTWQHDASRLRYYAPSMSAPDDLSLRDWIDLVESLYGAAEDAAPVAQLRPAATSSRRFRQLSTGEAKRFLLWGLLRPLAGPLILDEPYEHLSRDAKHALTATLRLIALRSVVIVATNQDVALANGERLLTLDRAEIQVLQ